MKSHALLEFLAEWQGRAFDFGATDCCQFARALVRKISGVDHGSEWVYNTFDEAQRILDDHGGLEPLISQYLGASVPLDQLTIGDLCLIRGPWEFEMMAARSARGAYAPSSQGVVYIAEHRIQCGWPIEWTR